jgi:GST-like protein
VTDTPVTDTLAYEPPTVWTWNEESGGRFASINRPIAGPTHEKELPVGRHPLQLYSLATPNGVKVGVMLEELLALGHKGAEYDAWLIRIDGDQFGSGFVAVNPNSKIPALMDRSGPEPIRAIRSGAILLHLAESSAPSCRLAGRRGPNACHGCSGRWAARRFLAADLATSMPTRRPRSNTRSTVMRWR